MGMRAQEVDEQVYAGWVLAKPVAYTPSIAELESIYYSEVNAEELIYWLEDELEREHDAIYERIMADERDMYEELFFGRVSL